MDQTQSAVFSTAVLFGAVCRLLDLDPVDVVATAGLPERIAKGHGVLITEAEFFTLWDTIVMLGARPQFAGYLARGLANGASSPVFFALSCAPDLQTGLERFAGFKHVFGPMGMSVRRQGGTLHAQLAPLSEGGSLPSSVTCPILAFLHEKARSCTASPLVPEAVYLPMSDAGSSTMSAAARAEVEDLFGVPPQEGPPTLVYRAEDATRRFVSENESLWRSIKADLTALATTTNPSGSAHLSISDRVRACLLEAISEGDPSIAFVCERLAKSRSGLLRELQSDGTRFQDVLTDTRKTLALRYLRNSDMPIKQVANLLAYRDPNAFHRAFKSWTGQTPSEARRISR